MTTCPPRQARNRTAWAGPPGAADADGGGTPSFGNKPSFRRAVIGWRRIAATLLLMLTVFSGCAGPGKRLEPPRVNLVGIEIVEMTVFEAVWRVELRVINGNEVPLTLKGADCDVEINSRAFAHGLTDSVQTVPAMGTITIPLTVYTSVVEVVRNLISMPADQRFTYRIKGRLRISGGFLTPSVLPFSSEGEINLNEMVGSHLNQLKNEGLAPPRPRLP